MAAWRKPERAAGTELVGQLAGEYRIVRWLGAGGFGSVYEAEHPLLRRKAAVKVLHANPGVNSVAVQRFIDEARSASQIRHRHIVDIFSFGTLPNGQYFYVMDLLEGAPLDRYLEEQGRLAPEIVVPLLRPIANAIDALHAASLVHRDLKPANIFLSWDSNGEVVPKLLDFGLVKLLGQASAHSASGVPIGTPFYMSPEQCRGESVDGRADVYSFGVICFELITGRRPFEGDSASSVLVAHVVTPPPRISELCPELTVDLDEPVRRMLAKDPAARPNTVGAALRELELAARSAGVTLAEGLPWLPRPAARAALPAVSDIEGAATAEQSGLRSGSAVQANAARSKRFTLALGVLALCAVAAFGWIRMREPALQPASGVPPQAGVSPAAVGGSEPAVAPAPAAASGAPSAAIGADPSAAINAEPSAAIGADPSAATNVEPSAAVHAEPGAAVSGEPNAPAAEPSAAPADPPPRSVPLMLRGAPPRSLIFLGDDELGAAPGPVQVPFGETPIRLSVRVPGQPPQSLRVTPNAPLDLPLPPRPNKRSALPRDLENPF